MDALLKQLEEKKDVPKKITPCPIVEAVVEIRFQPVEPDAVFGILYKEFQAEFPNLEKLAILQIPPPIRTRDPDLQFSPHYKLRKENLLLQIGPSTFSVVSEADYIGWTQFSKYLNTAFQTLASAEVASSLVRLGMRYINFFEGDIFPDLKLTLGIGEDGLDTTSTTLRTCVKKDKFSAAVVLASGVKRGESSVVGSAIDIDVALDNIPPDFFGNCGELLNQAHEMEKRLFFSLFKEPFKRFEAEY